MTQTLNWRAMTERDLAAVNAIADMVHPGFPEDARIFAERLALHPAGCMVLADDKGPSLHGYLLSHPWHARRPPALNSLLSAIPTDATTYYVHDIALLPSARGAGAASAAVARITAEALRCSLPDISLVAVNGSAPFWQHHGFVETRAPALDAKLASYGDDARYMLRVLT